MNPFKNLMTTTNIKELFFKNANLGKKLSFTNIAPYYFNQMGGEKKSQDFPQEISLDFKNNYVRFSSSIALVIASDSEMLIHSSGLSNNQYIVNLAPKQYPEIIGVEIKISIDTILVRDTHFGMFVRLPYNNNWIISIE